jgi:Na+-translocating ferredoxin:NAD+ oxidoreductase RnfG subunit
MKLILVSIVFVVFGDAIFTETNINRKRLNKEVENQFQLTGFELQKLENNSAKEAETDNGIFWTINSKNESVGYVYTGRVFSCCKNGCTASQTFDATERTEFFDYFILFDKSKTVISVVVYNYEATHGQEVTAKGWLKQFVGYNGSKNLVVGKNVDSISGATISVNSITSDITHKSQILRNIN